MVECVDDEEKSYSLWPILLTKGKRYLVERSSRYYIRVIDDEGGGIFWHVSRFVKVDGHTITQKAVGASKDVCTSPTSSPKCCCGGRVACGLKDYGPGHSDWCDVKYAVKHLPCW